MHASRVGVHASRVGVHASRVGVHASRVGVSSCTLETETSIFRYMYSIHVSENAMLECGLHVYIVYVQAAL